jgi:hypothetical protein
VFALVGGQLADILRAKKVCSTTAARRIFELTGKLGNFVITLIQMHNKTFKTLRQGLPVSSKIRLAAVVEHTFFARRMSASCPPMQYI